MESLEVIKNFDKRSNLILGDKFWIRGKERETGRIEFNPFMPRGGKRWKLQVFSSVYDLLLPPGIKGSKTTCICHFYCLHWWLQTVQYRFFLKFSNTTAGIFSQTLWYHSSHWLHCAISYFSSVGGTYGTRHRQYSSIFEVAESYLATSPVIVGNGVSFAIFKHTTRCAVIFFYHSFLSLDCRHTLAW